MESVLCSKITVREGLDRYRTDMNKIKELAASIKRNGQIQPILVTPNYELVAGGRRLAACTLLKKEVLCVFKDVPDDFELRLLEVEENLNREDFSPGEKCLAIRDLHILKQAIYGESGSGRIGGWTLDDTAKLLGRTRASIIEDIKNARMVDKFPELKKVKHRGDIKKAARGLEKLALAIAGLGELKNVNQDKAIQFHLTDAIDYMPTLENDSIDILLTDPLYGIEHDKLILGCGKTTGGAVLSGFKFNDSIAKGLAVYNFLAQESFRFTKDNAHGFIFLAPEHFHSIKEMFKAAGWIPHVKPHIWIKPNIGQCNMPTHWPASSYEMLLYVRKENSRLTKEGQPDYTICNAIVGTNKDHIYEKPVELLLNLLDRVSIPGKVLFDPFAGSCSSLIAGMEKKLQVIGCDNSQEAYAVGWNKIKEYQNK